MWTVDLDPSWCVTTGKLFYPDDISLLGSSPLSHFEEPATALFICETFFSFITLKSAGGGTWFANQVSDWHMHGYQGRDFQLGKVQPPTDQKEQLRKILYLPAYAYLCMYISVSVHIKSVCTCVHPCMCTCVFMHTIYLYCTCIHMHNCGCIFENTQSQKLDLNY